MMALTHIALATAICVSCKVPESGIALMVAGSLLPDIDQPRSMFGKLFFFVSIPLNKFFGHRKLIHSILLWGMLSVLGGLFFKPVMWLGLGGVSHCLLDCWNTKGVELLSPVTEKIFVLGSRKYRLISGTRAEFIVLGMFLLFLWLAMVVSAQGGISALFGRLMGNYETAYSKYEHAGKKVCTVEGRLRYKDGTIQTGKWLVLGTEGQGLAIYDEKNNHVVHVPQDGKFLKVTLSATDKEWESVDLQGFFTVESSNNMTFARMDKRWHHITAGDLVYGTVIHLGEVRVGERW